MLPKAMLIIICLLSMSSSYGQPLKLGDIQKIIAQGDLADVTEFLSHFDGWEYYNSESYENFFNQVTWTFDRNQFEREKAGGWLTVYFAGDKPHRVYLQVHTVSAFNSVLKDLKINGFKKSSSKVTARGIETRYQSHQHIVVMSSNSDENGTDGPFNNYIIDLSFVGGFWDENNGMRRETDENGNVLYYTLKSGVIHGQFTKRDAGGALLETGTYINGQLDGKYTFQDGDRIVKSVNYKGGNRNGIEEEWFDDPKGYERTTWLNDKRQGSYYKREEHETYHVEVKGNYQNDEMTGNWKSSFIDSETGFVGAMTNLVFKNPGQDPTGFAFTFFQDTLLYVEHLTDQVSKVKIFKMKGNVTIDTTNMSVVIVARGVAKADYRDGQWWEYSEGKLVESGVYKRGQRIGKWLDYQYTDPDDKRIILDKPFCEKYYDDNGTLTKRIQFGYIMDRSLCAGRVVSKFESDTKKTVSIYDSLDRLISISGFDNDVLHGDFRKIWYNKNTTDTSITVSGSYHYGKMHGTINRENFESAEKTIEEYNHGELIELTMIDNTQESFATLSQENVQTVRIRNGNEEVADYKFIKSGEGVTNALVCVHFTDYTECSGYKIQATGVNVIRKLNNWLNGSESFIQSGGYGITNLEGKFLVKGQFEEGAKVGKWYYYNYDKNLVIQRDFNNNLLEQYLTLQLTPLDGRVIINNEAGEVEEISVKGGYRNGVTIIKDHSGKTIRKLKFRNGLGN